MSREDAVRRIGARDLAGLVRRVLDAHSVPEADAATVAECLVCANLSGFDSHGVVRLSHYARRLANGTLNPRPELRFSYPAASVALLDGDDGLGHVATQAACRRGAELARLYGVASVSVRNSSHFGMAGYYIMQLAGEGFAALLTTATDAFLVPHGGSKPFFGTNPIAIGFPAPDIPVILDMATTSVAWGKLALAQKEGRKVPPEWGVDEHGSPCDDPGKIRGLHPIAGPKGSGLAMVIDVFSSLLAGMAFGPHIVGMYTEMGRPRGLGHFLTVWDVERFRPLEQFRCTIGQMIDELRGLTPAAGHERVFYPGEREGLERRTREAEGIPIEPGLFGELQETARTHGIAFDPPSSEP